MTESSSTRDDILREIKNRGAVTQTELAAALGITREAVRQHLAVLEQQSLITKMSQAGGRGRPVHRYSTTDRAERQFPKHYDALSLSLVRALARQQGDEGLHAVLSDITEQQVSQWQPQVDNKPLLQRMQLLRGIYFDNDPYIMVDRDDDGAMLIEHNCPYLDIALAEPRLCSVTLSTLQRLLGVKVERSERFQQGDGRCVFRVREDQPVAEDFRFEWEAGGGTDADAP